MNKPDIMRKLSREEAPQEILASLIDIQEEIQDLGEQDLRAVVFGFVDAEGYFSMYGAGAVPILLAGMSAKIALREEANDQ